jgi:starvation-inducible DNA-binding protein
MRKNRQFLSDCFYCGRACWVTSKSRFGNSATRLTEAPNVKESMRSQPLTLAASREIAGALTTLLADIFALYLKTKNFHWHMSGPHFRDYHLLLDDQGDQLIRATDAVAERVRKVGGAALRSIGHVSRLQRIADNDADYVMPSEMLSELCADNIRLGVYLREAHALCDRHGDVASASLLENWIDESEGRVWFLVEAGGHTEAAESSKTRSLLE